MFLKVPLFYENGYLAKEPAIERAVGARIHLFLNSENGVWGDCVYDGIKRLWLHLNTFAKNQSFAEHCKNQQESAAYETPLEAQIKQDLDHFFEENFSTQIVKFNERSINIAVEITLDDFRKEIEFSLKLSPDRHGWQIETPQIVLA